MSFSRKYIAKRQRQKKRSTRKRSTRKRSTRKRSTRKRKSMMKQKGGGGQGLGLTYYKKEYETDDNIEKIIYKNLLLNIQKIFESINKAANKNKSKPINYNDLFNPEKNFNIETILKDKLITDTIYPKLKSIKEETYNNKLRYRLEFNKLDEDDFKRFVFVKFEFPDYVNKYEFDPNGIRYKDIFKELPIALSSFVVYIKPKTNLFFKDNNFSLTKIDESGNETEVSNVFLNNLYYTGKNNGKDIGIDMKVFNKTNHSNVIFEKFESPKAAIQLENEDETPLGFGDIEELTTPPVDDEGETPLGFDTEGGRKRTRKLRKHKHIIYA